MFTTPNDEVPAYWGIWNINPNTSFSTGEANTATILGMVLAGDGDRNPDDGFNPNAFVVCDELVAHGHSDWYLPARSELQRLYDNQLAIGNFVTGWYWSSTSQSTMMRGVYVFPSTGATFGTGSGLANFRCVRK